MGHRPWEPFLSRGCVKVTAKMYGQQMKYPYTMLGKFMRMPWKHHFQHGRAYRYVLYSAILCFPVFYKISELVNSPPNQQLWKTNREKRLHDPFAPVTEGGHH